jgi:hypothetical protein
MERFKLDKKDKCNTVNVTAAIPTELFELISSLSESSGISKNKIIAQMLQFATNSMANNTLKCE